MLFANVIFGEAELRRRYVEPVVKAKVRP